MRSTPYGITNLPPGTHLLVSITRSASSYFAQDKMVVGQGGAFKTSQFSNRGKTLPSGAYSLEVMMPLPRVQPEYVKKVIGEKGENLSGGLINKGKLGITVRYKISFEVTSNVSTETDKTTRNIAKKRRIAWIKKTCGTFFNTASYEFNACYKEVMK